MSTSATSRKRPRKRRKSTSARQSGAGLWPWLMALVVVAGGIAAYENRADVVGLVSYYMPHGERKETARSQPAERSSERPAKPETRSAPPKPPVPRARDVVNADKAPVPPAAIGPDLPKPPVPDGRPVDAPPIGRGYTAKFYFCGTSGLDNCVVDGDTFWHQKTRIELADIVAPETERAKCQQERDLGFAAKVRLRDLLNAGAFELTVLKGQGDASQRVVTRGGRSLGAMLVSEGLAHPRMGKPRPWC
ncbi:nuclease [Agrobacterium sp. a22-2]|uniref:thermonuclease family protein n=1 Tax=Agrobacterium sp. a22-2 TaxID=2283840 RepID=UPI0014476452|nr:nuclease [Agrobacterium sp. a22-2]NKN36438.1 nuclease [Agrobacterium sp. a22-2]